MIVPTWPSILPISSTSSGATRYCRPPVLMTANIVGVLRVFDPVLGTPPGRLLVQSLWVMSCARPSDSTQKQAARETRAGMRGTYSPLPPRVKENRGKNQPKATNLAERSEERRVGQ